MIQNTLMGAAVIALATLGGCATGGQTGALAGGGIGALAGQAIGGNTEATLIGAAVGAGVGYIIGNEEDKKRAGQMSYAHDETGPLGGTRWQVVSLTPSNYDGPYSSKIIQFRDDGRVITTTTRPDRTVDVYDEGYRVVGRTLIVNKPGYIVNADYSINGEEMVMDADEFRAVLVRLPA